MESIKSFFNYLILFLSDLMIILLALFITHIERLCLNGIVSTEYDGDLIKYLSFSILYVVVFFTFMLSGIYTKRFDFWTETKSILKALFLSFLMIMSFVVLMKTSHEYSRMFLTLLFVNLFIMIPFGKILIKMFLNQFDFWRKKAYIIGESSQADVLRDKIFEDWYLGFNECYYAQEAKTLFIATKNISPDKLEDLVYKYKNQVEDIFLVPYLHGISFANAEIIDLNRARLSLIGIKDHLSIPKNIFFKKVVENILVILILPISLIIILFLSLLIWIDSKGKIFYRHERLGKNSKKFICFKFRTMYENGEEILKEYLKANPDEKKYYDKFHKYKSDPRLTKVGKSIRRLSLDELPQIFNILKGEMNLIGPRPYMSKEKAKMGKCKDTILQVKPGITGLWQVSGRNELEFDQRVELDCWYIRNWSLWLDFVIFLKTFQVLITRKGAK